MLSEQDIISENKAIAREYKELLRISYQSLSEDDKKLIRLAFDTAVEAHSDQRRKSGEAYIFHPIAVAKIVASEIGLDSTSIAAALLHDVVEDSDYSVQDIKRKFGEKTAKIVDGLTKIKEVFDHTDSMQAENFRKMLLTLSDDVRVIIIKLADRLHNMRTLKYVKNNYRRYKIALETLEIYAPLAERVGFQIMREELEDLAFKILNPKGRESIIRRFINLQKDTKIGSY